MNRSRRNGDDDADRPAIEMTVSASSDDQPVISMEQVADGTRRFLHRFFYPTEGKKLKKGVRVVSEEEEHGESSDPQQQQQRADPLSSPPSTPGHDAEDNDEPEHPALGSSAGAGGAPEPLPTPSDPNHHPRLQQQQEHEEEEKQPRTRTPIKPLCTISGPPTTTFSFSAFSPRSASSFA